MCNSYKTMQTNDKVSRYVGTVTSGPKRKTREANDTHTQSVNIE